MALTNTQPNGIKQIIRNVVTIANTATSGTATIAAVDPAKSLITNLGQKTGTTVPAGIELTNGTTVTATRAGTTGIADFPFQVVEYW